MSQLQLNKFIVKGEPDPYRQNKVKEIHCYLRHGDEITLPCMYSTIKGNYPSVDFPVPSVSLRDDQKKVLEEIMEKIKPENACNSIFCHLYTGFGKTILALWFATQIAKGPIIIVEDREGIKESWIKTAKSMFNITPHVATNKGIGKHDIVILSRQLATLNEFKDEEYRYYKTVICDEADTLCTQKAVNFMLRFKPLYFLGLSATIDKVGGLSKVLDVFWGPRNKFIRRIKNYTGDYSLLINFIHTGIKVPEIRRRDGNIDWVQTARYIEEIPDRYNIIRSIVLSKMHKKILITTNTKDYLVKMKEVLENTGIDVSTYYGDDKGGYIDANVVITTTNKGGRGNDDKNLAKYYDGRRFNMLIMTLTTPNPEQIIGRLRSPDNEVFVLVDDNSTMKNHKNKIKNLFAPRLAQFKDIYLLESKD